MNKKPIIHVRCMETLPERELGKIMDVLCPLSERYEFVITDHKVELFPELITFGKNSVMEYKVISFDDWLHFTDPVSKKKVTEISEKLHILGSAGWAYCPFPKSVMCDEHGMVFQRVRRS